MTKGAAAAASGLRRAHAGDQGRIEPWRDLLAILVLNHGLLLASPYLASGLLGTVVWEVLFTLGVAAAVMIVLHDAMHSRFSRDHPWVNVVAVHAVLPIGLWVGHRSTQHMAVHHRHPAVYPIDDFTRASRFLRLHGAAPLLACHRYQHWYAWPAYALLWFVDQGSQLRTLAVGDRGSALEDASSRWGRAVSLGAERIVCLLVVVPYAAELGPARLLRLTLPALLAGGLIAATILAVGHIADGLASPTVAATGDAATRDVYRTTASFAVHNRPLAWSTGGLSRHLAHHLFPDAPRCSLEGLTESLVVVGRRDLGVEAVVFPTLASAIRAHQQRLRQLGRGAA